MQHDSPAGGQNLKRLLGEPFARSEIPIVPNVREEDRVITARPGLPEHIYRNGIYTIGYFTRPDILLRYLAHRRQFHDRAMQVRMRLGHPDPATAGAADDLQR